jgi:MoaA/NifB/PqqE/SkfB family radical SAM enzyme
MQFTSVLISLTEICHVGCAHCGFIGAARDREVCPSDLAGWVKQVCEYEVPVIIFTGGEPFERFDCLLQGVETAEKAKTAAAVFTSSYWATSSDVARTTLQRLSGLKHLYLSSDPFHQRHIPYQNVFNVIEAALALPIPRITICITYGNEGERAEVRRQYVKYGNLVNFHEDRIIPNPYFSSKVLLFQDALRTPFPEAYRSSCNINTPLINPNGDVFSCHVGQAAAHRNLRHLPYFLGNLYEKSFAEIMAAASNRLDYQFLRTHGARGVAGLYRQYPELINAIRRDGFTTECDMCFSSLKIPEGRTALWQHLSKREVQDEIDMRLALVAGEKPLPIAFDQYSAEESFRHEIHKL